jgi:hypothetical protein
MGFGEEGRGASEGTIGSKDTEGEINPDAEGGPAGDDTHHGANGAEGEL